MKELTKIQCELKAEKSQYNSFGKYSYRSCEDILSGLKPLLAEHNCYVIVSDDVKMMANDFYFVATAKIINKDGNVESATGWAREPREKKGMDLSQISGATSSYARKYALNGLFAIDDAKDADATNKGNGKPKKATKLWLNPNTPEWEKAFAFVSKESDKKGAINRIKETYNLSKDNEAVLSKAGA